MVTNIYIFLISKFILLWSMNCPKMTWNFFFENWSLESFSTEIFKIIIACNISNLFFIWF